MADEAVKEFGGPLIIHPADTTFGETLERLPGRADNQVRVGYPSCHPAGMPAADAYTRLP